MIYKPGDLFEDSLEGSVKCVVDGNSGGCELCIFSPDPRSSISCDAKEYNLHPCYHSDRGDEYNVHFIKDEGNNDN